MAAVADSLRYYPRICAEGRRKTTDQVGTVCVSAELRTERFLIDATRFPVKSSSSLDFGTFMFVWPLRFRAHKFDRIAQFV